MVSSLVMVIFLAVPRVALISSGVERAFSSVTPASSERNLPPVKMAMSCMIAFLLSPKEGAFTAQIFKLFFNLLRISPARSSLSTSSEMIRRGLCS